MRDQIAQDLANAALREAGYASAKAVSTDGDLKLLKRQVVVLEKRLKERLHMLELSMAAVSDFTGFDFKHQPEKTDVDESAELLVQYQTEKEGVR